MLFAGTCLGICEEEGFVSMTCGYQQQLEAIKKALPNYEDAKRIDHTLGVLEECIWMAETFGLSDEDRTALFTAALLHDITKAKTDNEQFALCEKYGICLPQDVSSVISTLHQYTGAPFAREIFGKETVCDKVYSAIACHTTGKAGMSVIDKMLFVADFTEPGRKYRSCAEMREYLHGECGKINKNDKAALYRLLDDTVKRIIGFTVTYLIEKGRKIDAEMLSAWNAMV